MNKILIIVCTAVVALAIAVPSTILIMNKVNENNESDVSEFGGGMAQIDANTTFKEYSKSFKDDVTEEQLAEAESLFDELKLAMADEENENIRSLMMQLNQLGLFETEGQMDGKKGERPNNQDQNQGQGQNQDQRPNN